MSKSVLNAAHFHEEEAAYAFVEAKLWPNGPVCFHCKSGERVGKMNGKTTRIGLYKCYACRKPFTVKMGTVFEDSHVEMKLWLQAIHLLCASKKGISGNQLHRTLGVTLKSAWFMSRRIREAVSPGSAIPPMGGNFGVVESDETCIRKISGAKVKWGNSHKNVVLTLVERGDFARSFRIGNAAGQDIAFIDDHREAHGVEPICRGLPIAPSTYHAHVANRADPSLLSAWARRDLALRG